MSSMDACLKGYYMVCLRTIEVEYFNYKRKK